MKYNLYSTNSTRQTFSARSGWRFSILVLAASGIIGVSLISSVAQVQTAGTVFINVDATTVTPGALPANDITNSGSLGGFFESTNTTFIAAVSNVNSIVLSGTNYMRLKATAGGALVPPPAGLIGSNATCSIEVWALNPQVAGDECMISWGARVAGQNMAFEYGTGTSGAAQHFGADIVWDPVGGGAPLNGYWHHLVYTYDGSNQNVYADGVLANSQPVNFATTNNQGIALGAQWAGPTNLFPGTSPALATLAVAKIRVHDGTLSSAQVLNNYNFEKSAFVPAAVTPAFLTAGPTHRYSFNEPATNDATGLSFVDSIAGANGTVQGSEVNSVASFSGKRLVLRGGIQTTQSGYGAPYGDLPNGLVSVNSTNNGGSGEVSIEIWWKNYGGVTPGTTGNGPWTFCRIFDFGSCGPTTGAGAQVGVEVTGPGSYPSGGGQLDYLAYMQVGQGYASVNQRRLAWQNKDLGPAGSTTNSASTSLDVQMMGTYQTDRHVVVTWKESTGVITAYENGILVDSITATNAMSALNDINVWLGRSQSVGDSGFAGEYNEVRFYNYVLSPGQVLGDFQVGADTVNTAIQAPSISANPQSSTNNQGWPASFYVTASGSPGVSYQWTRNGTPIPGATGDSYAIAAVSMANNGDTYSCVVSNFANSTPNTVTSGTATLTVLPNVVAAAGALHETKESDPTTTAGRNNFTGSVGGFFQTSAAGAVVTHLGFYDLNQDGLNRTHNVGIYNSNTLVVSVLLPAGNDPSTIIYNGYRYIALPTPFVLAPNVTYTLMGEVFNGDGDYWPDIFAPGQWNTFFVGTNAFSTRAGRWQQNAPWPTPPNNTAALNSRYAAANMATLPIGPAQIWAPQTTVTQYVGIPLTLTVLVNGQAPVALQWYKAPSTLLSGQNGTSLVLTNPTLADAGDYYAIVSNSVSPFTAQSPNITLTILGNTAVSIDQQPTNLVVTEMFPGTFTIAASGTPPISYQWRRNGSVIADATNTSYTIAAASQTNNGDGYSCVVSNHTTTGNVLTSTTATLTVQPNQAPPAQVLYPPNTGFRDNFSGVVGGLITIGAAPALVTHLGFYSPNGTIQSPHHVGIFPGSGTIAPIASVFVDGNATVYFNSYIWVPLNPPITLAANTTYILGAEVFQNDGDLWPDVSVPNSWNPYFVGANGATTRAGRFSGGNWPAYPTSASAANSIYMAPNLAILPQGPPVIVLQQTNYYSYVGSNLTVTAFVDGEVPLTVQWYKSPSTALIGQTNATLSLANVTLGDAGTYYLIGNNAQGANQSSNVTVTILSQGPPTITQQPQSQTVYSNQTVYLNVAIAVPPLGYQWYFNNNVLPGATNSTLVIPGATTASNGNYYVSINNSFGSTNSSVATLTVINPTPGSYLATVLAASPILYYRFSDVLTGGGQTYNFGTRGAPYNAAFEGTYTDTPGPQPPVFPNLETNNDSLALDGSAVDAAIPPLNLSGGPNLTLAAWVNPNGVQVADSGIIFNRGTIASGLGVKPDGNNPGVDMLEYHWNNIYFQSNTFLDVPAGQWVFTALTISPNQAIVYCQDGTGMKTWTNNNPHASVPFDFDLYVGWDNATTARHFNGAIDEPMVFTRTLSATEINSLYSAAATVRLEITRDTAGNVVLTWPSGTLQQADVVTGPYTTVPSATSPYTNAPVGSKFYRLLVQ
ncbi:MAG TPA: LamG-like jellyroll fold domain-containing protein [Candidatus Dormibacteraeota bacterium]|nr:LamG-like jellyroll fold domain-containing protein [Candidatus Dormibacteraeota bacterium]